MRLITLQFFTHAPLHTNENFATVPFFVAKCQDFEVVQDFKNSSIISCIYVSIAPLPLPHPGITTTSPEDNISTDITSIIGFVSVLTILILALIAILLFCICYGARKLHRQPASAARRNNNPPPLSSTPVQRRTSFKGTPSYLQSPTVVRTPLNLNHNPTHQSVPPTPLFAPQQPSVVNLAQISSSALSSYVPPSSHSHSLPHSSLPPYPTSRGISPHSFTATPYHPMRQNKPFAAPPPLYLQSVDSAAQSPVVGRQKTPRSASTDFHPHINPAARAPRSASTEFYRPAHTEFREKWKNPPTLSSGGSMLESSGLSIVRDSEQPVAVSTITSRSTEV